MLEPQEGSTLDSMEQVPAVELDKKGEREGIATSKIQTIIKSWMCVCITWILIHGLHWWSSNWDGLISVKRHLMMVWIQFVVHDNKAPDRVGHALGSVTATKEKNDQIEERFKLYTHSAPKHAWNICELKTFHTTLQFNKNTPT